jgi:ferric-dicitrate binding protein FerR (iron transport regulator)
MNPSFEELMEEVLAGKAGPETWEALDRLLAAEPTLLTQAADLAGFEGLLRLASKRGSSAAFTEDVVEAIQREQEGFVQQARVLARPVFQREGVFRWQGWAVAAAAVVVMGIAGWRHRELAQASSAILQVAVGGLEQSVFITRGEHIWCPAGPVVISVNDVIELAAGAKAVDLQFDDEKTTVTLQPGAKFRVASLVPQKRFELDRGSLRAEVTRQIKDAPMLIQTPTAEAQVLGTVFTLAARSEQTGLTVERGVVRLSQGDGSAENIKSGQSAVASLGAPIRLVNSPAGVMPVPIRPLQTWVRGPAVWSAAGAITFDFAQDPKQWALLAGDRWEPEGHIVLHWNEKTMGPYHAVSPCFAVGPGERFTLSGKAQTVNGARLQFNYYLRDGKDRCFGFARIPGYFSSSEEADGFSRFDFEFQTLDSEELKFIALIVYCFNADGTNPRPGDAVLLDELTITRK